MADTVLPRPHPQAFDNLMRAQALALHALDQPPADRNAWEERRTKLRARVAEAMGPLPASDCPLEPRLLGTLKRDGFRIEKLVFQSRPDVWVTANVYVPEPLPGKAPAVLAVHGHWPWARIDPNVQARCLGLVKLGFVVLAVDAFGAGERYPQPAAGTYHGALFGSTLWPAGLTLLGCQVYDNRRAVDYLLSRPEVDGDRLGITGASGGGNQTMYAGALDERFRAVVPVCSVGTYQAYLHAACCVCEVLPGALRFAEEGDVLALVAPRALLVINATRDGFQFSVGEAQKSVARARPVFELHGAGDKLRHDTFESPHAYNRPMREAMYGWMTRWLKGEGDGKPIPEPEHALEKPEDLRCYPDNDRPKGFFFPPSLAGRTARALLAEQTRRPPDHAEEWESTSVYLRAQLVKKVFGGFPITPTPDARLGEAATADGVTTTPALLHPEPEMPLPVLLKTRPRGGEPQPACVVLHLEGKAAALQHPVVPALLARGWLVAAPDLRATGETKPGHGAVRGAPDHTAAEHALWLGRPLLGQWAFDVRCLLDWLALQPGLDARRLAVVGVGPAGLVALCAGGLFDNRVAAVAALDAPVSLVTDEPYAPGTFMGLLAPGLLRHGDVPQLAALSAPRRLVLAGGVTPQAQKLDDGQLREAFGFTGQVFKLFKAEGRLTVAAEVKPEDLAGKL